MGIPQQWGRKKGPKSFQRGKEKEKEKTGFNVKVSQNPHGTR